MRYVNRAVAMCGLEKGNVVKFLPKADRMRPAYCIALRPERKQAEPLSAPNPFYCTADLMHQLSASELSHDGSETAGGPELYTIASHARDTACSKLAALGEGFHTFAYQRAAALCGEAC